MIFPDLSAAVQHQRAGFMEVKQRLRQMELSYSILFPARLRVVAQETTYFFVSLFNFGGGLILYSGKKRRKKGQRECYL